MAFWLILLIVSVIFLILEMFTPVLFFINLSVAAAISAFISYCGYSFTVVTFTFLIVSIAAIGLIRPILLNKKNEKEQKTGMEDKYIGKTATVVEEIKNNGGRVAIYGEEWQAKSVDNSTISAGESVKIVSYDSIILTVEKLKEN